MPPSFRVESCFAVGSRIPSRYTSRPSCPCVSSIRLVSPVVPCVSGLFGPLAAPAGPFPALSEPPLSRGLPGVLGFPSVMLFGVGWVVAFFLWVGFGCAFFGFEPGVVRRVVTSRSGLYEGLGCSERLVYV
jgi:hypothetical protein